MKQVLVGCALLVAGAIQAPSTPVQRIDLAERLGAGKLRPVNRDVTTLPDRAGVHVSAKPGPGVIWIEGTDLSDGTIDVNVRGKDVLQQSFVGVAFHRKDDNTYEAVYLRPFNFQAADPVRHRHAVQYIAVPEFDWPFLRDKFPEEFERPVDPSVKPIAWVPLRVVVKSGRIQVFAGAVTSPTLDVRKLGQLDRGLVGLWVGNNSDGDFADVRITPQGGVRTPTPSAPPPRPVPPTRDPNTPGYVAANELPDGTVPPADADGNFVIGPTHNPAPDMIADTLQGRVYNFTIDSKDSRLYPGIARDAGTFGTPDPADPAKLVVTTSHPAPYTRKVAVYVPTQYVPGTAAPFIVGADGPDPLLFTALDSLIAQKRVPVMIAISIGNGSGDAQGSERGLEYDTMSGRYAEFVESEVLPLVEKQAGVKLTKDPDARAAMGTSSGGSAALSMAWYHPELYHRVLAYSGTFVNQQWPSDPATPHGAWEYHERLIPTSAAKPIRIWMEVGDRDLFNPNGMRDGMHDWVVANENMARVLAAKGYRYQFVFARNAGHGDRAVKRQTLPEALEWLWR